MATDPTLVFIIASGRSGSKFLRDVLGCSAHCAVIPYDINFVWRQGNDFVQHDQLEPIDLTDGQCADIRRRVLRLPDWHGKRHPRVLVEKTVSNSLRVPFVQKIFPAARFIHLVRDGRAVAESARRVWLARPGLSYAISKARLLSWRDLAYVSRYARNLINPSNRGQGLRSWGPRYVNIDQDLLLRNLLWVCAEQWRACISHSSTALAASSAPTLTVRYEDLIGDGTVIEKIAEFAGLPDVSNILAEWEMRHTNTHAEKWRQALSRDECEMLSDHLAKELALYGYELKVPVQGPFTELCTNLRKG